MRKRYLELAVAAFCVVAAGLATVRLTDAYSPASNDDDPVTTEQTVPQADSFDYGGAVVSYVAEVETFANAVRVHEAEQAAEAERARKAAEAKKAVEAAKPKPQTVAPKTSPVPGSAGGDSYRACVMKRESGNNYASVGGGMYGIIDSTWRAMGYDDRFGVAHSWQAMPAQQDAAYDELFARYGRQPWSPYNGC